MQKCLIYISFWYFYALCLGKWQYEVQLGSKGVMQIGWATIDCKFSQEIGVGEL
jgi:Kip1 ubiquitination-promoting complex protein 1